VWLEKGGEQEEGILCWGCRARVYVPCSVEAAFHCDGMERVPNSENRRWLQLEGSGFSDSINAFICPEH
jgi:hypothetical protein